MQLIIQIIEAMRRSEYLFKGSNETDSWTSEITIALFAIPFLENNFLNFFIIVWQYYDLFNIINLKSRLKIKQPLSLNLIEIFK